MDIYPTLCELTDIEAPSYLQGQSLVSVLEDSSVELKKEIYTRYKQGEAVIDKDYSYTEFVENGQYLGNMLYDMNNDRKQNEDISKKSSNLELVKYYSHKLKSMRAFLLIKIQLLINMKKYIFRVITTVAVLISYGAFSQSEYYVSESLGSDSNAGTEGAPFQSINKGISMLNPGDTVYVMEGVYTNNNFGTVDPLIILT